MKKLSLLLLVCMVSMLALAQTDSSSNTTDQDPTEQPQLQESPPSGVSLVPSSANFGNEPIMKLAVAPFTLKNMTSGPITVTNIVGLPAGSPYSYYWSLCEIPGQPLEANSSCPIWVGFTTSALGPSSGTLKVTYEANGNRMTQTASLSGNAVSDVTLLATVKTPHIIPCNLYVGPSGTTDCKVILINQSPYSVTITGVSYSTDYGINMSASTCPNPATLPAPLVGLGSCSYVVEYTGNDDDEQGTFQVSTSAQDGSPATLNLQSCRHYCN